MDEVVKSKVRKACEQWSGKEKSDEFLEWYEDHKDKHIFVAKKTLLPGYSTKDLCLF